MPLIMGIISPLAILFHSLTDDFNVKSERKQLHLKTNTK